MRWTTKIGDHEIAATGEELAAFKGSYVDSDIANRISDLFMFDMYVLEGAFGVAPHDILETVRNLEAGEPANGVKAATQFQHAPLRGLWHKHYFSAHFLASNILLGLGKNGMEELVKEVLDPSEPRVTEKMISEIARRVANEPIEKRHAAGKLTGEWVIFAKHSNQNFYLALNTHSAGDQFVYDRIIEHCTRNYPDLKQWIADGP